MNFVCDRTKTYNSDMGVAMLPNELMGNASVSMTIQRVPTWKKLLYMKLLLVGL